MNLKKQLSTLALLSSLALNSCANAQSRTQLRVISHTAGLAGFMVNSHLIMGEKEALLVDAQFTRSEANQVIEMIKSSSKELKQIYITHAHPDHYLGLEKIHAAFPEAQILARPEVVDAIKQTAAGKLQYWKAIYKDDLADDFVLPEAFSQDYLSVEGKKIQLLDLGEGESTHDTALYIEDSQSLISGDSLYSGVHLWLAENHPEEVISNAQKLAKLSVKNVFPGHGKNGGVEIIQANLNYVDDFLTATQNAVTVEEAKAQMLRKYEEYKLPIILELALQARMKK